MRTRLSSVTSDHGEEFLDHGGTKHGRTLYEEVLRVPLLIRMPDLSSAGRTFDRPVGLVDLMPTVLELVGAKPPRSIHGRSLITESARVAVKNSCPGRTSARCFNSRWLGSTI